MRLADYAHIYGNTLERDYSETMQRLLQGGLLETGGQYLAMTETGKLAFDLVALAFHPIQVKQWLLDQFKTYQVLGMAPPGLTILPAKRSAQHCGLLHSSRLHGAVLNVQGNPEWIRPSLSGKVATAQSPGYPDLA